jgi:hypothetical protein
MNIARSAAQLGLDAIKICLRNLAHYFPVSLIEAINREYQGWPSAKELAIFVVPFCAASVSPSVTMY